MTNHDRQDSNTDNVLKASFLEFLGSDLGEISSGFLDEKHTSSIDENEVERRVMRQDDMLKQWELFRIEMQCHQERLGKLSISFIELEAFDDAAKCAIKAEGIKYVIGRMPVFDA